MKVENETSQPAAVDSLLLFISGELRNPNSNSDETPIHLSILFSPYMVLSVESDHLCTALTP
jgi:hypothetical protein